MNPRMHSPQHMLSPSCTCPKYPLAHEVLLGNSGKNQLIYHPGDQSFVVRREGKTPLVGKILRNSYGIDTLPFNRIEKDTGYAKIAHGHVIGNNFIVKACNLVIEVDASHPVVAPLAAANDQAAKVILQNERNLIAQSTTSTIVCKFEYQLMSGFVLYNSLTRKFTLAWLNFIGKIPHKWQFADGTVLPNHRQSFIRFSELMPQGHEVLKASAYFEAGRIMLEFEFQQAVACPVADPQANYIKELERTRYRPASTHQTQRGRRRLAA